MRLQTMAKIERVYELVCDDYDNFVGVFAEDDFATGADNTLLFIKRFVPQNTRLRVADYLNEAKQKPAEMEEMAKSVAFGSSNNLRNYLYDESEVKQRSAIASAKVAEEIRRTSLRLKKITDAASAPKPFAAPPSVPPPDSSKRKGGSKKKGGKRKKPSSESVTKAKAIGTYTFSSFHCLLKVF